MHLPSEPEVHTTQDMRLNQTATTPKTFQLELQKFDYSRQTAYNTPLLAYMLVQSLTSLRTYPRTRDSTVLLLPTMAQSSYSDGFLVKGLQGLKAKSTLTSVKQGATLSNQRVAYALDLTRGISSVGRAFGWQPKGHRFEPGILHCKKR